MKWGAFCETFGATPRNRVLEIFLTIRSIPLSVEDVAEETELSLEQTSRMMKQLLLQHYILPVKEKQLYRLNMDKQEVKALLKAYNAVLDVGRYGEKVIA